MASLWRAEGAAKARKGARRHRMPQRRRKGAANTRETVAKLALSGYLILSRSISCRSDKRTVQTSGAGALSKGSTSKLRVDYAS